MYEITPSDAAPKFLQLASLTVVNFKFGTLALGLGNVSVTSNLAILYPLHRVMVWDFTSNRYTVWSTSHRALDDTAEIVSYQ